MLLNDFIYEDIRGRIESGAEAREELTLSALSRRYNVSLTPIRYALERLVVDKYLVKLDNGRVEVSPRAPRRRRLKRRTSPALPVSPESAIQADVINLGLRGKSDYIREEAAAAKYGVGRTVIRSILSRLAGRGLLEYVPRCGWRPRTFDEKDLSDFLRVREALEIEALEQARPRFDEDVLRQLLNENLRRKRLPTGALGNSLHGYWISLANNLYIRDFFDRHGVYYGALFDFAAPSAAAIEEMAAQHCDILELILKEAWGAARRALAEHIRAQGPLVLRVMATFQERE